MRGLGLHTYQPYAWGGWMQTYQAQHGGRGPGGGGVGVNIPAHLAPRGQGPACLLHSVCFRVSNQPQKHTPNPRYAQFLDLPCTAT